MRAIYFSHLLASKAGIQGHGVEFRPFLSAATAQTAATFSPDGQSGAYRGSAG